MAERDASVRLRRAVQGEHRPLFYLSVPVPQLTPGLKPLVTHLAENNLFLVKRLIKRTDMRNPDPNTKRYTSLGWAAIQGCEETFEFLLGQGHDDDELSKVRYTCTACPETLVGQLTCLVIRILIIIPS